VGPGAGLDAGARRKIYKIFTKAAEYALRYSEFITEPHDAKNSRYAKRFQASVILL
jgi:hypothetical protein